MRLVDRQAEQAELGKLAPVGAAETFGLLHRIATALERVLGRNKAADRFLQQALFFAELEIHGYSPSIILAMMFF